MRNIKHTKTDLKAQRDALLRYERYLPMLQLKKQQLHLELRHIETQIEENRRAEQLIWDALAPWLGLFATLPTNIPLVTLQEVITEPANIAGINIPVFRDARIDRETLDLFATPAWFDEAQDVLAALTRSRAELAVLNRQHALISEELRITAQRVNLFEKVKIPECRENIRIIRIFLGDEQTAGVVRAKFAKRRTLMLDEALPQPAA